MQAHDVLARRRDVDGAFAGSLLREVGGRVVLVLVRTDRALGVVGTDHKNVGVGRGGRQHTTRERRTDPATVAGRGHDDNAVLPRLLDRVRKDVGLIVRRVVDTERQVDHADVQAVGLLILYDPVDRGDDLRDVDGAERVGDLHTHDT